MGGITLLILNLQTVINLKESRYVMGNNIGFGDNYGAFTNSTNKSAPPAPVSSTPVNPKTAGGPGVLPNDKPDGFFASSTSSNIIATNSDSVGSDWSGVGAVEEKKVTEDGILSLPNTKGEVSLETVSNNVSLVKKELMAAIKENLNVPDAARLSHTFGELA